MAEPFTKGILDAEAAVPPAPRRTHKLGRCETAETSAALTKAWRAREDERRSMRVTPRDKRVEEAEDRVRESATGD